MAEKAHDMEKGHGKKKSKLTPVNPFLTAWCVIFLHYSASSDLSAKGVNGLETWCLEKSHPTCGHFFLYFYFTTDF